MFFAGIRDAAWTSHSSHPQTEQWEKETRGQEITLQLFPPYHIRVFLLTKFSSLILRIYDSLLCCKQCIQNTPNTHHNRIPPLYINNLLQDIFSKDINDPKIFHLFFLLDDSSPYSSKNTSS